MAARSTRGPGGGRSGGRRPPASRGGGRGAASSGCLMTLLLLPVLLLNRRRRLPSGDYIVGNTYVIGEQMDPGFVPPSGSLNPAATVAPYSQAGAAPFEGWEESRPGSSTK